MTKEPSVQKRLPEGFKLKYRGKKTTQDTWWNYSRCCKIFEDKLYFVSRDNKVVIYSLEDLSTQTDLAKCCIKLSLDYSSPEIQDLEPLSHNFLIVATPKRLYRLKLKASSDYSDNYFSSNSLSVDKSVPLVPSSASNTDSSSDCIKIPSAGEETQLIITALLYIENTLIFSVFREAGTSNSRGVSQSAQNSHQNGSVIYWVGSASLVGSELLEIKCGSGNNGGNIGKEHHCHSLQSLKSPYDLTLVISLNISSTLSLFYLCRNPLKLVPLHLGVVVSAHFNNSLFVQQEEKKLFVAVNGENKSFKGGYQSEKAGNIKVLHLLI